MRAARQEIEIKLRFADPVEARRRIEAIGAVELTGRHKEDNQLYERPGQPLRSAGQTLRLRRTGPAALLTLKYAARSDGLHKVRDELETAVDDATAMDSILLQLGFTPGWRYQKYRTLFGLDDLHLCLDETPLGCFVELEGSPAAIDHAAQRLGADSACYIRDSYRELHERAARDTGAPTDAALLFGPDSGSSSP